MKDKRIEVILFTSKKNTRQLYKVSVNGGDSVTKSTNCVRNLGALLESTMDMEQQVKPDCRSAYAQLRSIGHIRNI